MSLNKKTLLTNVVQLSPWYWYKMDFHQTLCPAHYSMWSSHKACIHTRNSLMMSSAVSWLVRLPCKVVLQVKFHFDCSKTICYSCWVSQMTSYVHPTRQTCPSFFTCCDTASWCFPRPMDWSWWSAILGTQISRLKHLMFVCDGGWSPWYTRELCKQEVHYLITFWMLHLDKLMHVIYRYAAVCIDAKGHI